MRIAGLDGRFVWGTSFWRHSDETQIPPHSTPLESPCLYLYMQCWCDVLACRTCTQGRMPTPHRPSTTAPMCWPSVLCSRCSMFVKSLAAVVFVIKQRHLRSGNRCMHTGKRAAQHPLLQLLLPLPYIVVGSIIKFHCAYTNVRSAEPHVLRHQTHCCQCIAER